MTQPSGPAPVPSLDVASFYAGSVEVLAEVEAQTDRGAAIVGVALLDQKLRLAIEAAFDPSFSAADRKRLFATTAPLGPFHAKVMLGRALGLYGDDMARDFDLLHRIRNRFAHRLWIRDFTHPEVASICEQLAGTQVQEVGRDGSLTPALVYRGPSDARAAFTLTMSMAIHFLYIVLAERGFATRPGGHAPTTATEPASERPS